MSVQLFESEVLDVSLTSVVSDDGEIYFKARYVATALGYTKPERAAHIHVSDEYKVSYCDIPRPPPPPVSGGSPTDRILNRTRTLRAYFWLKLTSREGIPEMGLLRGSSISQKNGFVHANRPEGIQDYPQGIREHVKRSCQG